MPTRHVSLGDHGLQRSLLNAIIEESPEGILVVDMNGIIISHNQQFVDIWRIPCDHLRGAEPDTALGAADDPILAHNLGCVKDEQAFLERVRYLYDHPHLKDHCEIELKDGRTLERHSTQLCNDQDQYLGRVWFFRDITGQKQTESALREMAQIDALTGVANRRHFFERANQEFSRVKRIPASMSVAELDIDHFKRVNDQHGHATGDKVLKAISQACLRLLREVDIFARIGGEEFAVLLPGTGLDRAAILAERLRHAIEKCKVSFGSDELFCTVSIGVTTLKSTDSSVEDCLLRADKALYRAKEKGRNRVEIEA